MAAPGLLVECRMAGAASRVGEPSRWKPALAVLCLSPDIPLRKIVWGVLPLLALRAIAIVLPCVVPAIATWLPNHYLGK
jgi:hypothetical protein